MIDRLSAALLAGAGVQKRIADVGTTPATAADALPDAFRKFLGDEIVKWEKVIGEPGVASQ